MSQISLLRRSIAVAVSLIVLSCSGIIGCSGSQSGGYDSTRTQQDPITSDQATELVETLADDYSGNLKDTYLFELANGDFGYMLATFQEEGALPKKIYINRFGRKSSRSEARRVFYQEHNRRWGAASTSLAKSVLKGDKGELYRVHVSFKDGANQKDISEKIRDFAAIEKVDSGGATLSNLKAKDVQALAKLSNLKSLSQEPTYKDSISGKSGPADYTDSDDAFNASENMYGGGEKVGILDSLYHGCAINSDHEAFDDATIQYTRDLQPCSSDAECEDIGCSADAPKEEAECRELSNHNVVGQQAGAYCVVSPQEDHTTRVASRISHHRSNTFDSSNPRHASSSQLVIYNGEPNDQWADPLRSTGDYEDALILLAADPYDGFDVPIVNKSLGNPQCDTDFYDHNMVSVMLQKELYFTLVKASGNVPGSSAGTSCDDDPSNAETDCHALNSVCVGSTEEKSGYDDYVNDIMADGSRHVNSRDSSGGGWTYLEIEEPDLVSEGENAKVASPGTNAYWQRRNGTSFAAPTVSGLLTLFKQYCGSYDRLRFRTLARQASEERQTLEDGGDFIYPTFPPGVDSEAGAGLLEAYNLKKYCGGEGSGDGGDQPFDGSSDWEDAPSSVESSDPDVTAANAIIQNWWGSVPGALTWGGSTQMKMKEMMSFPNLPDGSRVRASFSYQACLGGLQAGDETSAMGMDMDIALCGYSSDKECVTEENGVWTQQCSRDDMECFMHSASAHDLNEGFDQLTGGGQVWVDPKLYAFREEEAEGCGGYGWSAAWYWTP